MKISIVMQDEDLLPSIVIARAFVKRIQSINDIEQDLFMKVFGKTLTPEDILRLDKKIEGFLDTIPHFSST